MKRGDIVCVAISRSMDGQWFKPNDDIYPFLWAGKELRKNKPILRLIIGGFSFSILRSKTKMAELEEAIRRK